MHITIRLEKLYMEKKLIKQTIAIIESLYGQTIEEKQVNIEKTHPDIKGDYTLVVFPFLRFSKKKPEDTAQEIGREFQNSMPEVAGFNVIKGFLNIELTDEFWLHFFDDVYQNNTFGLKKSDENAAPIVIEYSSPNTNKPLHLGHIRNNLLGYSVANILAANGKKIAKVNLVNDRGIHICKSMLAWQKWGNQETPESTSMKGDHLIGKYYVLFDKNYKQEINQFVEQGMDADEAKKQAPLIIEAQKMLKKWESGDKDTVELWKKMNGWVYDGFDVTYKRMGVDFDKIYYESETYLLGKEMVLEGLEKGILFKKEDGSVWADLSDEGLDEKLLLRSDGTSVYMTQDLGTAKLRHEEYNPKELIYVVGNEQNYHFDVLRRILIKLGRSWGECIKHLSYGMVELPEGKMKSREGTVVDADDLMDEMYNTAMETTKALGKVDDMTEKEADELYHMVGMGALKYYILKVDPKKTMTFNPKESIDFNGNTGPFIQYTHARICSVLKKAEKESLDMNLYIAAITSLEDKEKNLLKKLYEFPEIVKQAGDNYSPAMIANYVYELVKDYNQFYHDIPILKTENKSLKAFRLQMSQFTARTIKNGMQLLGIDVPEKM